VYAVRHIKLRIFSNCFYYPVTLVLKVLVYMVKQLLLFSLTTVFS